ncbi:MAG: FecR domain-containing protein [Deltaproteobacteria bacterium]|nr:FecR domain-containing protein [Deltaproteobacteria bacterium]
MTKRVLIYGSLVAVLTIAGIVGSFVIFGEDASDALPEAEGTTLADERDSARARTNSSEAEKSKGALKEDSIKVISVAGSARWSQGEGEEWTKLTAGELLDNKDTVKTDSRSRVTLRVGEKSKLELAESGELSVGKASSRNRKFKLLHGRIAVDYKEKDRRLRIENQDGSTAAETEEGIFTVLNTGTTVAVATKTGTVDLFSGGQQVAIRAGQQSVASGGAPSRPGKIPLDVMLRVVDPGCRVQRESFIVLKGQTDPGAQVTSNGASAKIKSDGRFLIRVPLKAGKNNIVVVTKDLFGNEREQAFPCVTVNPRASIKKVDINWGPSGKQEES